jgi:GAF domain-containing protein
MTVLSIQTSSEMEYMNRASQLLIDKLQCDYAGIYLVDEMKEKLVLQTEKKSTRVQSPSNKSDLKITISPVNPASYESDSIKFLEKGKVLYVSQPSSLPEMERNLCYPLAIEGVIMGLVNIQSKDLVSGTDEELVWKIITGLISITLKVKQSAGGVDKQQRDAEPSSSAQYKSGWRQLTQSGPIGFLYDRIHTIPYRGSLPQEVQNTLRNKKSATYRVNEGSPSSRLIAPILLKANVIGTIGYDDPDPEHVWLPSEISMLETIASRVSLALENSRLVAEAENRAESEKIVGQITSRIRETLNIDTIIQTALQEFQQSFGLTEAEIRLQAPKSEAENN